MLSVSLNKTFPSFLQYLSLYSTKTGHLSAKFEKLVKLVGIHLTQYVYSMITSFQVSGLGKYFLKTETLAWRFVIILNSNFNKSCVPCIIT